jgi:hypothetical protein
MSGRVRGLAVAATAALGVGVAAAPALARLDVRVNLRNDTDPARTIQVRVGSLKGGKAHFTQEITLAPRKSRELNEHDTDVFVSTNGCGSVEYVNPLTGYPYIRVLHLNGVHFEEVGWFEFRVGEQVYFNYANRSIYRIFRISDDASYKNFDARIEHCDGPS